MQFQLKMHLFSRQRKMYYNAQIDWYREHHQEDKHKVGISKTCGVYNQLVKIHLRI